MKFRGQAIYSLEFGWHYEVWDNYNDYCRYADSGYPTPEAAKAAAERVMGRDIYWEPNARSYRSDFGKLIPI